MNELKQRNNVSLSDEGKIFLAIAALGSFVALTKYAIDHDYGISLKAAYKDFSAEANFKK